MNLMKRNPLFHFTDQFDDGFFSHSINQKIRRTADENAWKQLVLPIIIVCETTHRSLDSTENDRNVGKEMFQNLCIDDAWIIWTHSRTAIRRVSVVTAQTFVGCIAVDH